MVYSPDTIAGNLRALRAKARVSQVELSKAIGVDPSTIVNWESGKNTPSFQAMCSIADYYDVSLDFIRGKSA